MCVHPSSIFSHDFRFTGPARTRGRWISESSTKFKLPYNSSGDGRFCSLRIPATTNASPSVPSRTAEAAVPGSSKRNRAGKGKRAGRSQSRAPANRSCPSGLTRRECRKAATTFRQSTSGSRTVGPHECLPLMTQAECRAAAEAVARSRGNSHSFGPRECLPSMSRAQCKAAARAVEIPPR